MAKKYQLKLKGYVGGYDFDSGYVDYILSKNEDKDVDVLIDSLGGSLSTALSVAASFRNHGKVNVHFVGMNASAATIASMGARHISIESSAFYLVHKVSSLFVEFDTKNADQLQELIDRCKQMKTDLEKMDGSIAEMYAAKCKKSAEELLDLMKVGGWLTAKEAKEWGFVDEVVTTEADAPVLTNQLVASMQTAGIPVPNIPISDDSKDNFFEKLKAFFIGLFQANGVDAAITKVKIETAEQENNANPKTITVMKMFTQLCALLTIEAFAIEDGKTSLTEEQLEKIENALNEKSKSVEELQASVDEKQKAIDALTKNENTLNALVESQKAQIKALKNAPGASTTSVVNDKGADGDKSAEAEYLETVNSAKALYDSLP